MFSQPLYMLAGGLPRNPKLARSRLSNVVWMRTHCLSNELPNYQRSLPNLFCHSETTSRERSITNQC